MLLFKPRWRTRKLHFFLLATIIIALILITHQLIMFLQLTKITRIKVTTAANPGNQPRGVHPQEAAFYEPSSTNTFTCIKSLERIPYSHVNDNFCDCLDGTDEPSTSACPNGIFYCKTQLYKIKSVPSSKVNDGICDCCDGSDEWDNEAFKAELKWEIQKRLGRYQAPCPNFCHH